MEVTGYCKGLPLTIVIVAGILKTTGQEAWKNILVSLRSGVVSTLTDECNNSIELSYETLPFDLKPCFLSFGAFLEDEEIDAKRLVWLWIAEGFVRYSGSKSLEEVATEYLNTLIGRSLVMTVRERSIGGVKTCRIHDLLHDFCLRKSKQEGFLHVLKEDSLRFDKFNKLSTVRLCIHSGAEHFKESKLFSPSVRSLLFFQPLVGKKRLDFSFIFRIFPLLGVLSMDQVCLDYLPREIGSLSHLRYLSLQVADEVSPSIGDLASLEILILCPKRGVVKLPDSFWNLRRLRHLCLSNKSLAIKLPENNHYISRGLFELESLSTLYSVNSHIMEMQLRKCINIRRLKCTISDDRVIGGRVISFSFLSQLESLSLSTPVTFVTKTALIFPEGIKKLSFEVPGLSWDKISSIAELPNLEVLKLYDCTFTGDSYHVNEGEFSKLKVLKLSLLDIVSWTTVSDDQFSSLEKLVLNGCHKLEEIPELKACFLT